MIDYLQNVFIDLNYVSKQSYYGQILVFSRIITCYLCALIKLLLMIGTSDRAVKQSIEAGLVNVQWMEDNYEVGLIIFN